MSIATNVKSRYVLLVFLSLNLFLSFISSSHAQESIEVVTHPSVSVPNKFITKNTLRAIFGMRLRAWPDGLPVRVFVLPDDASVHKVFSKEKLNVFPYQLRSAWDRLIFSGTGQAPITVSSEDEMLDRIMSTPGAIGYLMKANINDNIQILHVK